MIKTHLAFYIVRNGMRSIAAVIQFKKLADGRSEYYLLTERGGWSMHTSLHRDGRHHCKIEKNAAIPELAKSDKIIWGPAHATEQVVLASVGFDTRLHCPTDTPIQFPCHIDLIQPLACTSLSDDELKNKMFAVQITTDPTTCGAFLTCSLRPQLEVPSVNSDLGFAMFKAIGPDGEPAFYIPYP